MAEGSWDVLLQRGDPSCCGRSQREAEVLTLRTCPRQDAAPARLWTVQAGGGGGNSSSKDTRGHVEQDRWILWVKKWFDAALERRRPGAEGRHQVQNTSDSTDSEGRRGTGEEGEPGLVLEWYWVGEQESQVQSVALHHSALGLHHHLQTEVDF